MLKLQTTQLIECKLYDPDTDSYRICLCTRTVILRRKPDEYALEFQQYWSDNCEQLVWDSWLEKFKDYVNPTYLSDAIEPTFNDFHINSDDINTQWDTEWLRHCNEVYQIAYNDFHTISDESSTNLTDNLVDNDDIDEDFLTEEMEEMLALGLPTKFSSKQIEQSTSDTNRMKCEETNNEIKTAFNAIDLIYDDDDSIGQVEYKMSYIKSKVANACSQHTNKHTYFNDEGDIDHVACNIQPFINVNTTKRRKRKKKSKPPPPPPQPIEIQLNQKLKKYWCRRFDLFSRFDEGIELDEESWYSVTPELIAKYLSDRCRCDLIVDAMCGAGGNAIQFAQDHHKFVIAIDKDPCKIALAQRNAHIYGVQNRINFLIGDYMHVIEQLTLTDVIFFSPPWGGPTYMRTSVFDLEQNLQPAPISQLLTLANRVTPKVCVFLPKNSNIVPLIMHVSGGERLEIEKLFFRNKLCALAVYYGDLVRD